MFKDFFMKKTNINEEKKSNQNINFFAYHKLSSPTWTNPNYQDLISECFENNVIVYRCVNMIAKNVSSIPINIKHNQQPNRQKSNQNNKLSNSNKKAHDNNQHLNKNQQSNYNEKNLNNIQQLNQQHNDLYDCNRNKDNNNKQKKYNFHSNKDFDESEIQCTCDGLSHRNILHANDNNLYFDEVDTTSFCYNEKNDNNFQNNINNILKLDNINNIKIKNINPHNPNVVTNDYQIIEQIILNPNATQSYKTFIESIVNFLLLSGNAYILYQGNSLHVLRPDRITIIPNNNKTHVEKYKYSVDGITENVFDVNEILHIKLFNANDDWYGLSPLMIARQAIDQHNAISSHNLSLLQNGGRPSGCLMVKNGMNNLTIEQKRDLRENINNTYKGVLNSGKIMILEGDFSWQDMGLSPKDMDFYDGKKLWHLKLLRPLGSLFL